MGPRRTKLSRRRAAAAARPCSPEFPYLVPPARAPAAEPAAESTSARHAVTNGGESTSVAEDTAAASGAEPPSAAVAEAAAAGGGADAVRRKRPLSPDADSAGSDGEDDLLPALPSDEDDTLCVGDIVLHRYRGVRYPCLVTRVDKKATVKFIYDLVIFKKAVPFRVARKDLEPLTYASKVRFREVASAAGAEKSELMLLALEAAEGLEAHRADTTVHDPEAYFREECDYIVRLRSQSTSPQKGARAASPPAPLESPLRPPAAAGADSESGESGDSDSEQEVQPLTPPTPPTPRPRLSPGRRAEQRAHAARLLELVESAACEKHLRAVHGGRADSWRRTAYARGDRRRLMSASALGDLETCPELAARARQHAAAVLRRLPGPPPDCPGVYADEVLAPEAVLYATAALSEKPLSAEQLDAELAMGAARFRP